jgi:uncharacterized membrane protein YccC
LYVVRELYSWHSEAITRGARWPFAEHGGQTLEAQQIGKWPGISEWLFAGKTFAAATFALYVALSVGLDRPYWATTAVYIVSQPSTGAVFYRLLGTLIGAVATIVLVPNIVNAPELLCVALALWIGTCLYLSLLDRTPRSYLFMLAGYTTALGFPTSAHLNKFRILQ